MKHRALLIVAGLVGAGTLAASLSVAAAGTSRPASHATPAKSSAIVPPKVPNAAAIKAKYHGQSIQFVGDGAVGNSHVRDQKLVARFQKDTGIKVNLVPHPAASDASYSQLARAFSSKSSKPDVMMLDVTWPGAFAPYLVNLKPALGKAAKQHAQGIVQNDTIGGKLIAMPWFGDFGILYYRTDLLKKYGYKGPPKTWTQLFAMAKKIQDGEQKTNKNFYGFVFQGSAYEGLTCDALEWVASAGGGHFISDVVFAGVFTFLIVWIVHGALYRWRRTATSDAAFERAIERVFMPPHAALLRFVALVSTRARRAGPRPGGT